MRDIKVNKITAQPFHFRVNGPGYDIPWCKFAALVILIHETRSIRQSEQSAFASQCLGNEK